MMNFLKTLLGGALGLAALYVTARIAYQAGKDVSEIECSCEAKPTEPAQESSAPEDPQESEVHADAEEPEAPETTQRPGLLFCIRRALSRRPKKETTLRKLLKHPEAHKLEAWVDGEDVHIDIRKRRAIS